MCICERTTPEETNTSDNISDFECFRVVHGVNLMKEWWIDPPRIWRVFLPRNTRCIDVHICECTTSEIDASELSVSDANSELVCFRVADIVNLTNEWWIDPPRIWRVSSPRDTRYDTIQRTVLSLSLTLSPQS